MSRDAPSLDQVFGVGAEEADGRAAYLDDLAERAAPLEQQIRSIYEAELDKLWQENRTLEGKLIDAGEEIERLRALVGEPK
jgi:hypothetical protein